MDNAMLNGVTTMEEISEEPKTNIRVKRTARLEIEDGDSMEVHTYNSFVETYNSLPQNAKLSLEKKDIAKL